MSDQLKVEARRHISRFVIVGALSVAVDGLFLCLLSAYLGMGELSAKGISYVLGMIVGFIGNKLWTFESPRKSAREPMEYLLLYALTLGVNVAIYRGVLAQVAPLEQSAGIWKFTAFLSATGTTTILNFLGLRFFTFKKGIEERRKNVRG